MASIIPLAYTSTSIGKIVKSSKKKHTWKFLLDRQCHELVVFESRISHKVAVFLDEELKYSGKEPPGQELAYRISNKLVKVYRNQRGVYDMRIGRFAFSVLARERSSGAAPPYSARAYRSDALLKAPEGLPTARV